MPCPCARGSPDPCHAGDPKLWPWWCRQALRARRCGRGYPVLTRCQAPTASREPRTPDHRPEDEAASSFQYTTPVVDDQPCVCRRTGTAAFKTEDVRNFDFVTSRCAPLRCEPPRERSVNSASRPLSAPNSACAL